MNYKTKGIQELYVFNNELQIPFLFVAFYFNRTPKMSVKAIFSIIKLILIPMNKEILRI